MHRAVATVHLSRAHSVQRRLLSPVGSGRSRSRVFVLGIVEVGERGHAACDDCADRQLEFKRIYCCTTAHCSDRVLLLFNANVYVDTLLCDSNVLSLRLPAISATTGQLDFREWFVVGERLFLRLLYRWFLCSEYC